MVHNGIEYADMQLIAEAYDLLRARAVRRRRREIAEIFREWNAGDLESFLIEITADVLAHVDAETGRPFVDIVLDQAEQKGTGRWTVQSALDLGVPITGIAEATFARALSGHAEQRGAGAASLRLRASATAASPDRDAFIEDVRLRAVRVEGGRVRAGLRPDRGRQRRVRLEHRPRRDGDDLARRLHHPRPVPRPDPRGLRRRRRTCPACWSRRTSPTRSRRRATRWRRVVAQARARGHPDAGVLLVARLLRRPAPRPLPAALIQGLRDNFGAHTYRRVDREGSFHTEWAGDQQEHNA